MRFWGWIFRIVIVALGISLFLLQSQFAKKSLLEFIVNQPFKNSILKVEATGIRGLFPFHFTVASLELKEGNHHIAALSNILAVWSVPSLMNQEIKVHVEKGQELAGEITYIIGKHALFSNMKGEGLHITNKGTLQSITIDLPTLNLLKGQIIATLHDGQDPATLTMHLEELDQDRLRIQETILSGKGIEGKGYGIVYPRYGMWEGEADITIAALASYSRWFQKELAGSAIIQCHKPLKREVNLNIHLQEFLYGNFKAKTLAIDAAIAAKDHIKVIAQGEEALLNTIPLVKLSAAGNLDKREVTFNFIGTGQDNISFHAQGTVDLPTFPKFQTQINITQAELAHPMHQFSLKQPTTLVWDTQNIQAPKLWIKTGEGILTIQDLVVGNELSGILSIDRLPLTLLRVMNPQWIASGYLSGKGKLKGTMDNPNMELFLEGKSLQWGEPVKLPKGIRQKTSSNKFLGIDLSSTFALSQGFLTWDAKLTNGRLLVLTSQGKLSAEKWYPTVESSLDAMLKGQGDMSFISLFMPHGDLIQGQASVELRGIGTLKNPLIKGHVSVVNGLYENAIFGTLIKNIKIQGNASGDVLTLSTITGKDNSKGGVKGQGSLKFTSLLNPHIDIRLLLDQLIVVQNDEISAKAKGPLKLQGTLWGDEKAKAKITGDITIDPIELRLDEHEEKIVTIKFLEKKADGSYQAQAAEHKQQNDLQKGPSFLPLDILLSSPKQIYLQGYGFNSQWKGKMRAIGTITDPQLVGEITLVQGKFELLSKPLKLTEGRITYSQDPKNDPVLSIVGTRDIGEITAIMRIEGHASDPKISFSSNSGASQEEVLSQLLFARSIEGISVTQSLLLANALNAFKGKNNLNFTDKLRSAFGIDVLEFKERKSGSEDEFQSPTQQVSVGKQISDKVYFSIDQSVSGDGGTSATVQFDVTSSLKIEADIGGDKNTGVGFAWVKKY
jgi:translocation and assembly module TamB